MKHGSRITAFVLIFCMLAGALCALAVPRFAKADSPADSGIGYFDDFWDIIVANQDVYTLENLNTFYSVFTSKIEDNHYLCCVFYDTDNDNIFLSCFYNNNTGAFNSYGYADDKGINTDGSQYFVQQMALKFRMSDGWCSMSTSVNNWNYHFDSPFGRPLFNNNIDFMDYTFQYFVPSPYVFNSTNIKTYISNDIGNSSMYWPGGWSATANLELGHSTPPIYDFNLIDFWLGDRHYISITDQFWLSRMDPVKMGYLFTISASYEGGSYVYNYDDLVFVPGGENFINYTFENAPDGGIYAIDITGFNLNLWDEIILAEILDSIDFTVVARAINTPLNIQKPGGLPNSSTETWNYWYTYINNYPTSAVIPENLGEVLYGVIGTKSYPVEVLAPASIINAEITGPGAYFGEGYFQYHFALNDNSALNYDILDVCVCSEQNMLQNYMNAPYSIRWWYDDSLSVTYKDIKDVNFSELFDMYDIVMIVDDPEGFIHDINTCYVYTGDSDLGFQYSSSEITTQYTMKGFAFVTKKAIQKQLLFNFNDGITKSYKLMSDYIEKRDLWDNSFLEWTTTLFTQIQTLDGRLDENGPIYRLLLGWNLNTWLSDIVSKLDQIARNTSEDTSEVSPWYVSLWNFVTQFAPSENDFATALEEIADVFEDIPLLPDPSPAPTIPLLPVS